MRVNRNTIVALLMYTILTGVGFVEAAPLVKRVSCTNGGTATVTVTLRDSSNIYDIFKTIGGIASKSFPQTCTILTNAKSLTSLNCNNSGDNAQVSEVKPVGSALQYSQHYNLMGEKSPPMDIIEGLSCVVSF